MGSEEGAAVNDGKQKGFTRREFMKVGGAAGLALQVGALAGAAYQSGQDKDSYVGWRDREGTSQFVDRESLAVDGPAYITVGPTRRPNKMTEYVFGRAYYFRMALTGRGGGQPWDPESGPDGLEEPLRTYYREHPADLANDLKREQEILPRAEEHHEKYDAYFRLAEAWADGWSDVFRSYPARLQSPPVESDFEHVNDEQLVPSSPQRAAELIKKVAHHYGATLVGICKLNPDWVYDQNVQGGERGGFEVPAHWEYAIAIGVPHEWDQMLSNPAHGTSYDAYARSAITAGRLTAFLKSLGYPARAHHPPANYDVIVPPILVDAGIGQQSRAGFVITPETGGNFRAAVITTNFPMAIDKPIEFGVTDFCNHCKICAEQCPSGSISFADSNEEMTTRGYRHWEINSTTCFNYWQAAMGPMGCRLCISVCPYSRKHNWVHDMVRRMSTADPSGQVDRAMTWMQKKAFKAPGAEAYLPPPDGHFAGYRPAPDWLEIENWFDVEVVNPQKGG